MTTPVNESTLTATCRTMHPASVKYTFGFESGTDTWTYMSQTASVTIAVSAAHRGGYAGLFLGGLGTSSRTITGLTSGRAYVFSVWLLTPPQMGYFTGGTATIGVSGIGAAATTSLSTSGQPWSKLTYAFTATATSHSFQLTLATVTGIVISYWDDILVVESEYQVATVGLKVLSSRIALDDSRSPYGEATLVTEIPIKADLDLLDTRLANQVRVTIAAGQTWIQPTRSPQSRTYDLGLHHRQIDYEANTLTMVFRTDEALLIDSGNTTATTNTDAELDQKSLRSIIATKLEKYFTSLAAGVADFDLTVTKNVTNRIINPSFESVTTGAVAGTGASALASIATLPNNRTRALRFTAAAGTAGVYAIPASGFFSASPLTTYTWSFYLASSVSRSALARIIFYSGAGTGVLATNDSAAVATSTTIPGLYTVTATAPLGTTTMAPYIVTSGNGAGNLHYTDAWMLTEGATSWPYFDGGTATDTYYSYAWTGTADLSESQRIRLDSRDPKLLQQEPGEKDWDFLAQLVQTAGLRLFSDESRLWRLVDPATYTVAGTIALDATTNLTRASDTVSKETEDWYDSVVVKYSWIDDDGTPQVAYDAAGTANTVLHVVEWQRPYPGPGAAAAILARAAGRGRVQQLRSLTDLTATPAQTLTTDLGATTPAQTGKISAVQWSWSAEGNDSDEMTITSRGLVDL